MAPHDNTRADIAVLQIELKHMSELVERNHRDAKTGNDEVRRDIKALAASIEQLNADLNERRGAEKTAKWIVGLSSGSIGAGLFKLASYLAAAPK